MLVVIMLIVETIFKITRKNLYVPIVTLTTKDNVNLAKQLKDQKNHLKDESIGMNINQK